MQINYRLAKPYPDHIMVSFSGDPRREMTVTWRTDESISDGYIEYREAGSEKKYTANAVMKPFTGDVSTSHIFWAKAENLKPGTKYIYTCGGADARSAEYSFTTQEESCADFTFLIIADHQKDDCHENPDYSPFNRLLKRVLSEHPEVRFILTLGDNTNCGQHEIQWNAMFEGMEGVIESLPYMMSCGNHDNRGFRQYFPNEEGRYYAEPAEFFNAQLEYSYPKTGPGGWEPENFSFDYGNCHFTVYGVNAPELVNDWSMKDLDRTDKTWKLGVYHFPIYPSIPPGHNFDAYPWLRPAMERQDIMFAGHEHNFARTFPIKGDNLYDRPSQGTVHYMLGSSNDNPSCGSMQKIWHAAFYPQEEHVSMFGLVHVSGGKIRVTGFLDDGRIVDDFTLDRERDEILPHAAAPKYFRTRLTFKGADTGLAMRSTPPVFRDGTWFIPFGTLAAFVGGTVERTKDKIRIEFYGHFAEYACGSAKAVTDRGGIDMGHAVFRGAREQLFIPIDGACEPFEMRWTWAADTNYIDIQNEDEARPAARQP